MTIREELIDYAEKCISGEEVSGKKHGWACQRLLRDCLKEEAANVLAKVENGNYINNIIRFLLHVSAFQKRL